MRIVFMGSAPLACVCLDALIQGCPTEVVGLVCQPDRPKGRHLKVSACPVKERAAGLGIPLIEPERVSDPDSVESLRAMAPDLIVVVAYGQILRRAVLDLPSLGCINIHASLLPRYRGAAPIQWAIASGEAETGVTAMFLNERMDAGDIILQRRVPIGREDTAVELSATLAREGAVALLDAVEMIRKGMVPRVPQDEAVVTYAPKLKREDGRVRWDMPAEAIRNRVRAFVPWPGCFCDAKDGRGRSYELKILRCRVEHFSAASENSVPGVVLDAAGEGPLVSAGDATAVRLLNVQPEGRKAMRGEDFLRGYGIHVGATLG